jgi:hypothetical protein
MTSPTPSPPASTPVTMWVAECPFRKNGSPVLGNMGARLDIVILFSSAEWKRLCVEVPALATMQFRVGTYE